MLCSRAPHTRALYLLFLSYSRSYPCSPCIRRGRTLWRPTAHAHSDTRPPDHTFTYHTHVTARPHTARNLLACRRKPIYLTVYRAFRARDAASYLP